MEWVGEDDIVESFLLSGAMGIDLAGGFADSTRSAGQFLHLANI
jgi:hypothetical protein